MNSAILNAFPTASEAKIVQIYIPGEGWTSEGDLDTLSDCHDRGATVVCLQIFDQYGETLHRAADFYVRELLKGSETGDSCAWTANRYGGEYTATATLHGLHARIESNRAEDLMGHSWTDSYTVSVGLFSARDFPAAGHHTPQGALAEARRWAARVARTLTIS